jgi:hypothetical protein
MNINPEQINILKKYGIKPGNHIDDILEELDDKITEVGFDDEYELTEDGLKLQLLYDQLYNQN